MRRISRLAALVGFCLPLLSLATIGRAEEGTQPKAAAFAACLFDALTKDGKIPSPFGFAEDQVSIGVRGEPVFACSGEPAKTLYELLRGLCKRSSSTRGRAYR